MKPLSRLLQNAFKPESPTFLNQTTPHVLKGRQASVAAVIRVNPQSQDELQLLFILRAKNKRDRWSGHVGFPGGHRHESETVVSTAQRECFEECGLDLSDREHFIVCGALSEGGVPIMTSNLTVFVIVFFQHSICDLPFTLDPSEVAAARWVGFRELCADPKPWNSPNEHAIQSGKPLMDDHHHHPGHHRGFKSKRKKHVNLHLPECLHRYSSNHAHLTLAWQYSVYVPPLPMVYPVLLFDPDWDELDTHSEGSISKDTPLSLTKVWILWGLTYGFTGALLERLGFSHSIKVDFGLSRRVKLRGWISWVYGWFGRKPRLIPIRSSHKVSTKKVMIRDDGDPDEEDEGLYLRHDEEEQEYDQTSVVEQRSDNHQPHLRSNL